jgi:hypothetical protein
MSALSGKDDAATAIAYKFDDQECVKFKVNNLHTTFWECE